MIANQSNLPQSIYKKISAIVKKLSRLSAMFELQAENYIQKGKLNILDSYFWLRKDLKMISEMCESDSQSLMQRNNLYLFNQGIGFIIKYKNMGIILASIRSLCGEQSSDIFVNIGCNKGEIAKGYILGSREIVKLKYHEGIFSKSYIPRCLLIDPNSSLEVQSSLKNLCEEYSDVKYLQMGVGSKAKSVDIYCSDGSPNGSHEWIVTGSAKSNDNLRSSQKLFIERFDNIWHQNFSDSFAPSYMRIMTNGNDLDVLMGCGSLIESIKVICFSLNAIAYNFKDIFVFLESKGFSLLRLSPDGFIPVESERSKIDLCTAYRTYFAIKNELLHQIS